jgi:hypothetical protein
VSVSRKQCHEGDIGAQRARFIDEWQIALPFGQHGVGTPASAFTPKAINDLVVTPKS